MRDKLAITLSILSILTPALAGSAAGQTATSPTVRGSVNFGWHTTDVSGDSARFQRLRDMSDGAFVQQAWFERRESAWNFRASADKVGRGDQRYWAEFKHTDRLQVTFLYDQIPLFMSNTSATLFTGIGTGTLRLADGIQQAGQLATTSTAQAAFLENFIGGAQRFDLKSRRDTTRLDVVFRPTREYELAFRLKNTIREGTTPYGFYLTQPIEVPQPVDTRTTDIGTSLRWANSTARLSIGYTGSWFENRAPTLVVDNPWRSADSATLGSSQGQMALWPNNTLQALTASAAVKMAARSHLTATVTFGSANQNEVLLPFTINSALASPGLPRRTADAQVQTTAMNLGLTSRPHAWVWLSARWRYYDSENKMPTFVGADYIRADQAVTEFQEVISTAPLSFTRNNVDLDVSFTPRPFAAARVGYSRNESTWQNRIFTGSVDETVSASVDTNAAGWLMFRGIVERSSRKGTGFQHDLLEHFEEQPTLRHFDIADRDRDRVTALVQFTPTQVFGFSASASKGKDEYTDAEPGVTGFGLKAYDNRRYTLSFDLTPTDQVSAGVWYAREDYTALQQSRTSNPGAQFIDPRRNWALDSSDKVDTVSAELDLRKLGSKVDVKIGGHTSRSTARYIHSVVDSSVIAAPNLLPPVKNTLDVATVDVFWPLTDRLGLGALYRFDRYQVSDFTLDENTLSRLDLLRAVFVGYVYRPYTANSIGLRLNYRW